MSLEQLRDKLVASGCDKNQQVFLLLQACLDDGPQSGANLRNRLKQLGYDRVHTRITLESTAKPTPGRAPWKRLAGDLYELHA